MRSKGLLERIAPLLALLVLAVSVVVAAKEPKVAKTEFSSIPTNLFYFEDTDIVLVQDRDAGNVYRSTDAGASWDLVDGVPKGQVWEIWQHPFDNTRAYALGLGKIHWRTENQGKTWIEFEIEGTPALFQPPLSFHAESPRKIMLHAQECLGFECKDVTYITSTDFSTVYTLRANTRGCNFAKSSVLFTTGSSVLDNDRILCVVKGRYSPWPKDNRLVVSDDDFVTEFEPELAEGRTVQGIINMAVVKKHIVTAAKSEGTDELALYVTDDAQTWHRAEFPNDHKLEEDAYTILESTNYSIQVDVMTTKPTNAMGVLFSSNSNGTYFTRNIEHTNRDWQGLVDFEKVQGIQGIVLVNTVSNWEEVQDTYLVEKKVQSKISFDDGRTFQPLRLGEKNLHLHSVTDMHNAGRIFSSPAPGLIMGVGNTGDHLEPYEDGDLYVSDDAGLTWWKGRDEAHKYEFGDQGSVLVAVFDEDPTNEIAYSLDHGHSWETVDLGENVKAKLLTTTPDSTSLKFILVGTKGRASNSEHFIFSIDFSELQERKCKDKDFEDWYARVDEEGSPSCLMGHKQFYRRRKAKADCFVDDEFHDPVVQTETCACSDEDFECDYNFVPTEDGKGCQPAGRMIIPQGECEKIDDTYMGSSGYRLIPGNDCDRAGGVKKDEPIERKCSETVKIPASGQVSHIIKNFRGESFKEYYYLERTESSTGDDETVVMRTSEQEIWITHDHGKTWEEILPYEDVMAIYPHQYFNDVVFFITDSKSVHYSTNRGDSIREFKAPEQPNRDSLQILGFHPDHKDWLIWTGAKDCSLFDSEDCHSVAHISTNRGDDWNTLLRYVRKCKFVTQNGRVGSEKLIYCEQYQDEDTDKPLQLIASDDWFAEKTVHFKDIIDFATMSEYIVVAAKSSDQKYLKVDTSVDGKVFADAEFPPNFNVPHQQAYTVLDSSTHAVFLHVTVNTLADYEYGTIIKSNSNGTSYVLSLNGVNRNFAGYVDFEKMEGIEGVAIVNIVDNIEEAANGQAKELKTMITHNDGAEWALVMPPKEDAEGKAFDCSGNINKCSLHLHGYTERSDPRHAFSSPSAIGLMMAIGNVGEYLGPKKEGDTFITQDGGVTWNSVKKGTYMWEYGDQGSVIVIVEQSNPTNVIFYTRDEGKTWNEYQFSEEKMQIDDISTVPSDNSRNFMLWGTDTGSSSDVIVTVNLDFTGLTDRKCELSESDPESGDYYLWSPKHPLQDDDCLFGHVAQYHRKRPEANCYNGQMIHHLHATLRNCSCTRQDFECDYNYERQNDGTCKLVPGLSPADHSQICTTDPSAIEYYEPTGYRRIPITTCQGGRELDISTAHPCPGREDDFNKKRKGISGIGLFFAIVIPFGLAAGVGYWVWRNWDGKFGRIRLGGSDSSSFDSGSPWVSYPVAAVSAIVAVLAAVPLLMASLWRSASGLFPGRTRGGAPQRYTTRSSFARGRGDYAAVENDEGELLGEDSDEEV
ncbi:MAG: vacuolar protein sorting/targeting protein PEP1 [Pycnora praestabilis]|nr:MAG: vacuolar protein sorting/targeting protein PEP1 [Pycnora praestabilis]